MKKKMLQKHLETYLKRTPMDMELYSNILLFTVDRINVFIVDVTSSHWMLLIIKTLTEYD